MQREVIMLSVQRGVDLTEHQRFLKHTIFRVELTQYGFAKHVDSLQ